MVSLGGALAAPIASDSFQATTTGTGGTYNSTSNSNGQVFGQNPTAAVAGFGGAWSNGNNGSTGDIRVETSGLTHPLLQGTAQDGDIYATQNNILRLVNRPFTTGTSGVTGTIAAQESSSGEIWLSGLVSTGQVTSGGSSTLFGLSANTVYNTTPSTGVMFGVDDGALGLYVNGALVGGSGFSITTGVTYLVAIRIDFTAGGTLNDSVRMEIYSPTATFGNPTATITASGLTINTSGSNLSYLSLSRNGATTYSSNANTPRFDEFRLGLLQSDVMMIPEPSVAALLVVALGASLIVRRRRV